MENGEFTQKYLYTSRIFIMLFRSRLRVLESARNVHRNERAKNGLKIG